MKNLLFALALCLPLHVFAEGGLPSQPYLYVQGHAQVDRLPDLVVLSFTFQTHDRDQAAANKQMQERVNKLFGLLDQHKIAQDDVDAGDLRSEVEYEHRDVSQSERGKVTGFSVTRRFMVVVRKLDSFPKLIDALLEQGVENFDGLYPRLSDEDASQSDVRDKALANAREQAERTLKTQKMKIDSVFAISPVPFASITREFFGDSDDSTSARRIVHDKPDPTQYRIQPITRRDTVHVIYLISPAK